MTLNGVPTSLYLQKELIPMIDAMIAEFPAIFKSRNHFVNSSIVRELRRIKSFSQEEIEQWQTQEI